LSSHLKKRKEKKKTMINLKKKLKKNKFKKFNLKKIKKMLREQIRS